MRFIALLLILFAANSSNAQTVYKTPSGKKYHVANCHMVKNVSEAIELSTALAKGLEPCKICNPYPEAPNAVSARPQGEALKTTQCKGSTKSGSRCRHMTSIANGYCYQHQPG